MTEEPRLVAAREEIERNLYHLRRYAARVRDIDRASPVALTDPDDRAIEAIEQFVLRFLKTVDAATRRLFPVLMAHLGEHEDGMPLIDVLNRLEKLSCRAGDRLAACARSPQSVDPRLSRGTGDETRDPAFRPRSRAEDPGRRRTHTLTSRIGG
ncbi:MAG: hypothetical protein M3495_12900 [Pseudomonadota bacterium]|nr:hypothetical protein [Gammaproteobacteria bacterium]MDQ3582437.1 hypothetical protein [Pseudomonadota bacterium]